MKTKPLNSRPIDLFASLSRRDMGTRNGGTFVSLAEAPPARRPGKRYGDRNESPNSNM